MLFPLSIRKKAVVVLWGVCLLVLASAAGGLLLYESATVEQRAHERLGPLADVIEVGTVVAVTLKQPEPVNAFLLSLRTNPDILEAHVREPGKDQILSSYCREPGAPPPPPREAGIYFWGDRVELVRPLHLDDKSKGPVGLLHLVVKRSLLGAHTRQAMLIFGCGMAVVMVGTVAQTILLKQAVIQPIAALAEVAESIREGGDFQQRAPAAGDDEVGRLGRRFNEMLDAIQHRDATLRNLIRELEAKNAELEGFTYTVSHDLRSPLITVKGFAAALLKDLAAGRTSRMEADLRRISDAADRMTKLLANLLELSRVGRIVNPAREVPLPELLAQVLELLAGPIQQRQVKVEVQPGLPALLVDPQRMMQVFQNLLENAIKFMGTQPAPRIEIGLRESPDGPVLFVRDNGLGIEPSYQETVFGLFNKLDAKTAGTGIGLALVRRIIEVHGGRIWVESDGPGQGSTFCFRLASGAILSQPPPA